MKESRLAVTKPRSFTTVIGGSGSNCKATIDRCYCFVWSASTVDVRLLVPAQPVDATPSNQLIRQYFPLENQSIRLYSIRTRQGSVPFESTLANDFSC